MSNELHAEAREQAARIWCEPQHSHKVFDPELAESFANALATMAKVLTQHGFVKHAGTWITREEADRISKDGP